MRRWGVSLSCSFIFGIWLAGALAALPQISVRQLFQASSIMLMFCAPLLCLVAFVFRNRIKARAFNIAAASLAWACMLLFGVQRHAVYYSNTDIYKNTHNAVESIFSKARFFAGIKNIFGDSDEGAVATALLLGDKSKIGAELKRSYREAGVAHTLALSGLHVGIIWSFISFCLSFLNISHKTKGAEAALTISAIILYVLLTGASPSVVRAAIMLSVYKLSSLITGKADRLSSVALAAFLIVLWSPASIHNIGFQLSFCSVLGITLLYPTVEASIKSLVTFRYNTCIVKLLSLMGISVCCQIATLPLVLYYFHSLPQYFLLSNIIAIPLVTISLYASILSIITWPLPYLSTLFASLAHYLLHLLNTCITSLSPL